MDGAIGLGARTELTLVMLLVAAAAGLVYLLTGHERQILIDRYASQMSDAVHLNGAIVSNDLAELRRDVAFLSRVPPIQGMLRAAFNQGVDPVEGNAYATWEKRLQEIFSAYIVAHPAYYQIRYIGVANDGLELVRVELQDGRAVAVQADRLQAKKNRDYFQAALQLKADEVGLSELNLNRERDMVEVPYRPTVRATAPVFGPDGKRFGMVVVNLDAGKFLGEIQSATPDGLAAYVANEAGDYLSHPDGGRSFGFDLGQRYRWQDDLPGLRLDAARPKGAAAQLQGIDSPLGRVLAIAERVHFDPGRPDRYLTLIYALPESVVEPVLARTRNTVIAVVVLSASLIAVLLLWGVRRSFAPLERLKEAANQIAGGRYDASIPEAGSNEVGELAGAFRAMQQGVAEREALYRAVAMTARDGFWMLDMQGRLLEVNDAYVRLSGFSREELLTMNVVHLDARESPEEVRAHTHKVLRDGSDFFESEHRRKDGTRWPVSVAVSHWPIAGGRFFVFLRDITERKKAEQELRASEDLANSVMNSMANAIAVLDESGVVIRVNSTWRGFAAANGAPAALQAGVGIDYFAACRAAAEREPQAGAALAGMQAVLKGEQPQFALEYPCHSPDAQRWFALTVRPLKGERKGLVASHFDITARKLAELALQAHKDDLEAQVRERTHELKTSEARTRAVLKNMLDGVVHIDAAGRILSVNDAIVTLFGYGEEEMLGLNVSLLMPEPHASAHDGYLRRYLQSRQPRIIGQQRELEARRRDGSRFLMSLAVSELADDEGSIHRRHPRRHRAAPGRAGPA